MEIKTRHHYIWQYYLRPWTINDEKNLIYCLHCGTIDHKPYNLKNLGIKKHLHRIEELSNDDVLLLEELIIKKSPKTLIQNHRDLVNSFTMPFQIENVGRSNGANSDDFKHVCKALKSNLHEELHTRIENTGRPYLDSLQKGDCAFYKIEDDRIAFLHFLYTQYYRTNNFRKKLLENYAELKRIWNVFTHLMANNSAYISSEFSLTLLENRSNIPFITGDQPAINTFVAGKNIHKAPDNIELYYPVSPKYAVLIFPPGVVKPESTIITDERIVDRYNRYIVCESDIQIYSNSKEVLKKYKDGTDR